MKKATAIGFRSNSYFAGLNTTIPNTDHPSNNGPGMDSEDFIILPCSAEEQARNLVFPLHGTIGNGKPYEDDQFFPDGAEEWDSWHVTHFVFEHEIESK